MSDEQVPQGSIPPKASPFSKPEGASPITPVAPGAPRPITVRLKPAAPAAATPAPAAPAPEAPAAAAPTPQSAAPRLTARIPIPEMPATGAASVPVRPATAHVPDVSVPPAPAPAPTVRLRPVAAAPASAAAAPAAAPVMTPISPALQPTHPPAPGSNPLPDGPKPPSGAQVQAAKSKTSRISLDSAIGVAPMTPMSGEKAEPKTIRLKRPADLAAAPAPKVSTAPIRQTSRIPDSVLPTPEAAAAEAASVTQKKTLKIKRPGGASAPEAGAASAAEGAAALEGVTMTPISALEIPEAQEESKVFTGIAVAAASAAAVVLLLLTICLGAHSIGTVASKNTTASLAWGFELPWPGRIAE